MRQNQIVDPDDLHKSILSQSALKADVVKFLDLQPETIAAQGSDRITALTLANFLAGQAFEQNVRVSPQRMTLVMASDTQAGINDSDQWFARQISGSVDKLVLEADHYSIMNDDSVALIRDYLAKK
jgi:hypothetical protein